MMKRTTELRRDIKKLAERAAHLVAQALKVEAGINEWSAKTRDGAEVERVDTHKINHSEACAYWREVRETEERLDARRAELRALEASGAGEPVEVLVQFNGGPAAEKP